MATSPVSLLGSSRYPSVQRRAALAGRAEEMRALEQAYARARDDGRAFTVTVLGAAGIGKTRLVRDFLGRARELGGPAPRVLRGAPREGGPAYDVFARLLRARLGLVEGMDPEAAKAQVRAQLASILEDRKVGDVAYFLGQLLELHFQDSPLVRAVEGDTQQMRAMRRAVVKSFLETDAGRTSAPLVLVFDDLQWAQDDSLQLLGYLLEHLRGPILVVCVARSELLARDERWADRGGDRHVSLELPALGEAEAAAMMRDLLAPCGDAPQVENLVDAAVTLAAGNPALLEQTVRVYHEAGVLTATDDFEDERWTIRADRLASVKLPLTVQDAVQARIAVLTAAERELLERAASIGGVFWLSGLVAIARYGSAGPAAWEGAEADDVIATRRLLDALVERDYVLRLPDSAFPGDEEYVFKHNLEREAFERMISPAAARRYHKALAAWLPFRMGAEPTEELLEMLGRHRERAGAGPLAAAAFVQAGEVARSRYANARAAELFARALKLLAASEVPDEDLRLRALHHHGDVLQALGRADDAAAAFQQMLACAWRLDLRSKGGAAHSRIGRIHREAGRLDQASRHLAAALALFGQGRDDRGVAAALGDIGKLQWLKGDYALALEYTLRSLAMRRKIADLRNIALCLNNLAAIQQDSGNPRAAIEALEEALRIRREIDDLVGVCDTLTSLGTVAQSMLEDQRALAFFQEAYDLAREVGDRNRVAVLLAHLGETHSRLGDPGKAIGLLAQAEELAGELGDWLGLAGALRGLARAYLTRREHARARECAQKAVDVLSRAESRVQLGAALRSLGEVIAAGQGDAAEAAACFERAIRIFQDIGNEIEIARASRAYADLLKRSPGFGTDPAVVEQAGRLSLRADEIFARFRAAAESNPALPRLR